MLTKLWRKLRQQDRVEELGELAYCLRAVDDCGESYPIWTRMVTDTVVKTLWRDLYEQVKEDRDRLRREERMALDSLPRNVDGPGLAGAILHMRERLDEYRDVLEFYANRDHYTENIDNDHCSDVQCDRGYRARAILDEEEA